MKIFCKCPTVNISKLNFWLVISYITKKFIWTTLKSIFSIFRFFFAPSDCRFSNNCISAKYCSYKPYINGKLMYSAFRWYINLNLEKLPLMTGLVVHGHISSGSCMQLSNVSCDLLIYHGKINECMNISTQNKWPQAHLKERNIAC